MLSRSYLYVIAAPLLVYALGMACNQAVEVVNGGLMPVVCNPSVCGPDLTPGRIMDGRHVIAGPDSRLMALADIWNMNNIYSAGDGFLYLGEWMWTFCPYLWAYAVIRRLHEQ